MSEAPVMELNTKRCRLPSRLIGDCAYQVSRRHAEQTVHGSCHFNIVTLNPKLLCRKDVQYPNPKPIEVAALAQGVSLRETAANL